MPHSVRTTHDSQRAEGCKTSIGRGQRYGHHHHHHNNNNSNNNKNHNNNDDNHDNNDNDNHDDDDISFARSGETIRLVVKR